MDETHQFPPFRAVKVDGGSDGGETSMVKRSTWAFYNMNTPCQKITLRLLPGLPRRAT